MSTVIDISDLTESVDGSGAFDKLMQSVKGHLQEEFSKGRITGVNYSNVYLGGMTSVMQQSLEFVLRKDLTAKQVDLTQAQIDNTLDEIDYRSKQKDLLDEEILLKKASTEQTLKQTELLDEQIKIAQKELILKEKEVTLRTIEIQLREKELVLLEEQVKKAQEEVLLIKEQVTKTKSEVQLLNAKVETEAGQTQDVSGGIIGAQQALYAAQTQGFANDHTYKMTKLRADIYSVQVSSDPTSTWDNPPPSWILG